MTPDLFRKEPIVNLLPCDGTTHYHGPILSTAEAGRFFDVLMTSVPWRNDEVVLFGKRIVMSRKVAWYGDAGYEYAYSGTTKRALPWTDELRALKDLVEARSGAVFNSCLLNLYPGGEEGMSWHSDDEATLVRDACIASVSLGAQRTFRFKHKRTGQGVAVVLENGSLLLMKDETQTHWLHSLPKSKKVREARINLTFRAMVV